MSCAQRPLSSANNSKYIFGLLFQLLLLYRRCFSAQPTGNYCPHPIVLVSPHAQIMPLVIPFKFGVANVWPGSAISLATACP
jgi:hypothetical protein